MSEAIIFTSCVSFHYYSLVACPNVILSSTLLYLHFIHIYLHNDTTSFTSNSHLLFSLLLSSSCHVLCLPPVCHKVPSNQVGFPLSLTLWRHSPWQLVAQWSGSRTSDSQLAVLGSIPWDNWPSLAGKLSWDITTVITHPFNEYIHLFTIKVNNKIYQNSMNNTVNVSQNYHLTVNVTGKNRVHSKLWKAI